MTASDGYVRVQVQAQLATVEFHHPQSNSLPGQLLRELADAIRNAGNDPDIRVIVLRSHGEKTFCAGASFHELSAITDMENGRRFFRGFADVINAMRTCPKLIIGRVQGKCAGGGVGLAAAVDHCLALDTAQIRLSELTIGIGPFVIGPAVERKMGLSAFSQLSIDAGNWRDAAWAKKFGLFAEIYPTAEALDQAVMQLADMLISCNPIAMTELKRVLWSGTEDWDRLLDERAGISGSLVLSEHTGKAIGLFKKKA
jgi:methylglutaconyl-CoA hydratase